MNTKNVVMIVDDEEAIRKLLKARFEREGLIVLTAGDAGEAGAVLAQNRNISLIVSDVKMPGKDGITFTKEVKEQHKGMKVIVMTGHGEKSTAIQALRIGASDYLEKPFDMEEMVHAVNRTLKERSLEKANETYAQNVVNISAGSESSGGNRQEAEMTFVPQTSIDVDEWSDKENTSSYTVLKKKWSEAFEKEYLTQVLVKHGGNVTAAAKEASVDRSNFLRLLRRHQIDASVYRNTKKAA
ncbi:MAG: response regulator [Bdellovibrionales bacterium]|nr:response regulator [Bdellovibrionales bacterium]